MNLKNKLSEAMQLRKDEKAEEAIAILKTLLLSQPDDPDINAQLAYTYDSIGQESNAIPFYEKAIDNNLVEDRCGAMLGLGSSYRCLGEYEKSLKVFDVAILEFPKERSLKVFRALTIYNLGKSEESVCELLLQLLDTTADASIKSYDQALRFYSKRLNETWT